ncbi:MAG: HDIG domain-containing protein [Candidatus Omnitrophica bacterium]|nr:HDIG domain-containing protein [Candidatus Omnitrophota bacterium]
MTKDTVNAVNTYLHKEQRRKKRIAWLIRLAIFFISFLLTTLIVIYEEAPDLGIKKFVIGEPAARTFFAPFAVSYENTEATERLRTEAVEQVPYVLTLDESKNRLLRERVDVFLEEILKNRALKETPPAEEAPPAELPALSLPLSEEVNDDLMDGLDLEELRKNLEEILNETVFSGIISSEAKKALKDQGVFRVSITASGKEDLPLFVETLSTIESVKANLQESLKQLSTKDRRIRAAVFEIVNAILIENLFANEAETDLRKKKAHDLIVPVMEEIKKNELVVQRGMLVNADEYKRLEIIHKKLATKQALAKFAAIGILLFLTYLFGFFYMLLFEQKALLSLRTVFLMHLTLLITTLLCKAALMTSIGSPFLMPAALAPILVGLLINPRLGILCATVMAVIASSITGLHADVLITTLLSSTAGVFAGIKVRKRVHFLKVGLSIGAAYFCILFAFRIFQEYSPQDALMVSFQGLANGLLIVMPLAFLLLPFLETVFDLVTDITLLEYSDLNHPLLKKMIVEAPGTYHHSLVVSTLSESACEAIGANALLARVGCYFHDIGKIARAEYFTENQPFQAPSRHENLTPTMSCLVILNHVKDGIELGRRNKLKRPILDFIPEHQGTGVIYYFYKKALDQARPGEKIHVEDFRYPGPRPQSRETAVSLLADSTEAASRSLKDPNPETITQLVRKIINDKFIDGQLDECNLTLRDLHKIQESFVKNLMAIYHTRVSYPKQSQESDAPDIFEAGQFSKFRADS